MKRIPKATMTMLAFSLARLLIYFGGGSLPAWVPDAYKTEAGMAGALLVILVWGEKRVRELKRETAT